jgi:hypothetical protein
MALRRILILALPLAVAGCTQPGPPAADVVGAPTAAPEPAVTAGDAATTATEAAVTATAP